MLGAIAGSVALLLLAVILALVLLPVHLRLRASGEDLAEARIEVAPFAGLLRVIAYDARRRRDGTEARRRRDTTEARRRRDTGKPARRKRPRDRRPGRTGRWLRRRIGPMLRAAPRLLAELLAVVRIERLRLDGRIGLDDPADTGALYAVLMPLHHLGPARLADVRITPDFMRPGFRGDAEFAASVVPVALLPPVLRWAWAGLVAR